MSRDKLYRAFANKRVAVWGLGREGLSTLRFLQEAGHGPVGVYDQDPGAVSGLYTDCVPLSTPEALNAYDLIVKAPGIPMLAFPQVDATRLTSQTEVFLAALGRQVIGITGTKGKSTTATLTHHILKSVRGDVLLAGNIGIPCLDLAAQVREDTLVVFELSCHQLQFVRHSPHVGVLLNLYQDHLDHYGTLMAYRAAKENLFRFQGPDDLLVTSAGCTDQIEAAQGLSIPVIRFSDAPDSDADIRVQGNSIHTPLGHIEVGREDTCLLGAHNRLNIAVAYYLCHDLHGISDAAFRKALGTYQGLPHRLRRIATVQGVDYYDDSISTVPETTIAALSALGKVGSLLLGGLDRGIDYRPLAQYLKAHPVDHILLLPGADRLGELLREAQVPSSLWTTEGMAEAVALAKAHTPPGKACLLSPAAASYGYYQNFEARGDDFVQQVRQNTTD